MKSWGGGADGLEGDLVDVSMSSRALWSHAIDFPSHYGSVIAGCKVDEYGGESFLFLAECLFQV